MTTAFLHKELSKKILACFYSVRNRYGMHHNERVYHCALIEELEFAKIAFASKPKIILFSLLTGKKLTYYEPDFIIENKIILELKANAPFVTKDQIMQVVEYIKISEFEIAYLVNFKEQDFRPRRIIFTNDRKNFILK